MRCKAGLFSRYQAFRPTSLSGLTGWFDASDSATLFTATTGGSAVAADGTVARFEDKSGSARHMTQATTANRPARKTSIKNGLDVLRFDGSNDRLFTSALFTTFVSASASTVFVVANAATVSTNSATPNANATLLGDDGGGFHGFFSCRSNGTALAFARNTSAVTVSSTANYTATNWAVFSALHDGTNLTSRINGTDATSAALTNRSFATNTAMALGANQPFSAYFNGDVGEVVVYNVALSTTNRDTVETYLRDKWAI